MSLDEDDRLRPNDGGGGCHVAMSDPIGDNAAWNAVFTTRVATGLTTSVP